MESIKIFENAQFGQIRTAMSENNEPMFCLADLCQCLGLTAKGVNQRIGDEVISNYPIVDSMGRTQQALFVTEDGMYDVVLDSRKPQAKAFRKWVTTEVLPSIRKTGGYIVACDEESEADIMAKALQIAKSTLERKNQRIAELQVTCDTQAERLEHQQDIINASAPKVRYYNEHLQSVETLTTTQVAKEIGIDANKLNQKLKEIGVLFRQSGSWMPKQPYCGWGLHAMRTQTYTRSDGTIGSNSYLVWKPKGRLFINALAVCGWKVKDAINFINGK